MMTVINFIFALLASSAVLLYIKYDNAFHVTLRGKRVLFIFGILFFFGLFTVTQHFYVDCDLRANATNPCTVGWL